MEWDVFLVFMGLLLGFIFMGVGVCFGRLGARELRDDNSGDVLCDRDSNLCDSSVGNIHGEEHNRCDMEEVLRTLAIGGSRTEREAIEYAIECIDFRVRVDAWIAAKEQEYE